MPRPTPNWQPLSMLPMMTDMVAGMLDEVNTQIQSLRAAQEKPHVLDDYTVGRVLKVYGEQQDLLYVQRSSGRPQSPGTVRVVAKHECI